LQVFLAKKIHTKGTEFDEEDFEAEQAPILLDGDYLENLDEDSSA